MKKDWVGLQVEVLDQIQKLCGKIGHQFGVQIGYISGWDILNGDASEKYIIFFNDILLNIIRHQFRYMYGKTRICIFMIHEVLYIITMHDLTLFLY